MLSRETRYERPTADNADTSLPGVMKVMRKSSVGRVLLSAIHDHEVRPTSCPAPSWSDPLTSFCLSLGAQITAAEVPAHERRSLFMDTDEEDPHVTSAMQSAMEVSASTPARAPGGLLLPDGSCPIGLTEGEAIELKALRSSVLGAANNSSAGTPGGRSMSSIDDVMTADLDDAKP